MRLKPVIDHLEPRLLLASLESGVTVADSVTGAESNNYTFTGEVGHEVIAVVGESIATAFMPAIDLLNSNNVVLRSASGTAQAYLRFTLPNSGTYTLRVRNASSSDSGSYKLTMFIAGEQGDETDNSTGAIASGRRIVATAGPGDLDVYTIQMTAGQTFSAVTTETNADDDVKLGMDIVAPNGTYVIGKTDREGVATDTLAAQTGTYYILVRSTSQATGTYGYSQVRVPGNQYASESDYGQLTSGVTKIAEVLSGDIDVFYFYVTPNTTIELAITPRSGSNLDPFLMLYLPNGEVLASGEETISKTSSFGGTYWAVARDKEADDSGTYEIALELGSGTGASSGSTLSYTGTGLADRIVVTETNDILTITHGSATTNYYAPEVDRLKIMSLAGNDLVDASTLSIRAYIFGGNGDDTLKGGSGRDTLSSGAGNNYLYGGKGMDRLNGSGG